MECIGNILLIFHLINFYKHTIQENEIYNKKPGYDQRLEKIAEEVKYVHDLQHNTTSGKKSWKESGYRSYLSTERSF